MTTINPHKSRLSRATVPRPSAAATTSAPILPATSRPRCGLSRGKPSEPSQSPKPAWIRGAPSPGSHRTHKMRQRQKHEKHQRNDIDDDRKEAQAPFHAAAPHELNERVHDRPHDQRGSGGGHGWKGESRNPLGYPWCVGAHDHQDSHRQAEPEDTSGREALARLRLPPRVCRRPADVASPAERHSRESNSSVWGKTVSDVSTRAQRISPSRPIRKCPTTCSGSCHSA